MPWLQVQAWVPIHYPHLASQRNGTMTCASDTSSVSRQTTKTYHGSHGSVREYPSVIISFSDEEGLCSRFILPHKYLTRGLILHCLRYSQHIMDSFSYIKR